MLHLASTMTVVNQHVIYVVCSILAMQLQPLVHESLESGHFPVEA